MKIATQSLFSLRVKQDFVHKVRNPVADGPITERQALENVRSGKWRIVHKQRKRTLRKRGVRVWYCALLWAYVWEPKESR